VSDTRNIFTPEDADTLCRYLVGLPMPFNVTVKDGESRTLPQNALLHKWFGEIAKHHGDRDTADVKGQMHRDLGLNIRLRDPVFAWVWKHTGELLPYEKQCKLLASGALGLSSGMSSPQLKEYMNAIQKDCAEKRIAITIPEDRKQ